MLRLPSILLPRIKERVTGSASTMFVDTTKIHTVEGCSHRFCLPCMNKHIEVMLLRGMAPRCPQPRCTTKLTVEEGSKALLPSQLLEMMVQRVEEEHIYPSKPKDLLSIPQVFGPYVLA